MNDIRTRYDSIKNTPVQSRMMQIRNHPYFKPALLTVAAAGGAFLAVRSSLKQITTDVHHMANHLENVDHNLYNASTHVIDEIHYQQKFRRNARKGIDEAVANESGFAFYPGVGVRYDHIDDNKSAS